MLIACSKRFLCKKGQNLFLNKIFSFSLSLKIIYIPHKTLIACSKRFLSKMALTIKSVILLRQLITNV